MEQLLKSTAAFKILSGDKRAGRLSHAYMLHFPDADNIKAACALFAAEMYGGDSVTRRRILDGTFSDVIYLPDEAKELRAKDAEFIVGDCAIRPAEGDRKIYVLSPFDISAGSASRTVQNSLLKTLEEPPEGVYFLLGVVSLTPVLTTVRSRVKMLEVPPFSEREIYDCLEREHHAEINKLAAAACGGILGAAQAMARGTRFDEINAAAMEICLADERNIGAVCAKYGDFRYKKELLSRMQTLLFSALTGGEEGEKIARRRCKPALMAACENVTQAAADLKFNAQFAQLLYDFCLRLFEEDAKWKKLSE